MPDRNQTGPETAQNLSAPIDARVDIVVSGDKMRADAVFHPPENDGADIRWLDVEAAMTKIGIRYGIDKPLAQRMVDEKVYGKTFVLAAGLFPENGTDAVFDYGFDRKKTGLPKVLPDGTVDFHNLDRLTLVEERALLLTLTPHTDGRPGISVFDTPVLQKKGKPGRIIPGKNTLLSPDGLTLYAAIAGEVKEQNGKISVSDFLEIATEVGSETGDIIFSGNIRIRGGVTTGFRVISSNGSIEVMGVTEGAYLEAEGNVILQGGLKGGDKGEVVSRCDIVAKFLENCKARASGNIRSEVIINSDVSCLGVLDASVGKGLIVGKTVRAGKEISCKTVGSRSSALTQLEVGIDPIALDRYKAAQKELQGQKELLEKLTKSMDYLIKLRVAGKLSLDQMSTMGHVRKSIKAVEEKLYDLNTEIDSLTPLVEDVGKGRIRVSGIAYPGTKLVIGRSVYILESEMQYCSFARQGADIRMGPY